MKKALFLDRDGVINREIGDYIRTPEDFVFNPGVIDFLQAVVARGYHLVIITNQGGIAKGLYSAATYSAINQKMLTALAAAGIVPDAVYHCPHHPDFGRCLCRKPGSLLIQKALARFGYDAQHSFMLGDQDRDVEAAQAAGIAARKVVTNQLLLLADFPELS
jgi:D-glycero-D-manno-heptose 1,7-bisphosphate phosphatase